MTRYLHIPTATKTITYFSSDDNIRAGARYWYLRDDTYINFSHFSCDILEGHLINWDEFELVQSEDVC